MYIFSHIFNCCYNPLPLHWAFAVLWTFPIFFLFSLDQSIVLYFCWTVLILLMDVYVYVYIQSHFLLLLWTSASTSGFCSSVEFSFFIPFFLLLQCFFFLSLFFIIIIFNFLKPIIFFCIYSFLCLSYCSFPLVINL